MPGTDPAELFSSLPLPEHNAGDLLLLSGTPFPDSHNYWIAKDSDGSPVVLLTLTEPATRRHAPPIVLEHLTVQHDVNCCVHNPGGGVDDARFTVIRCVSGDTALNNYFLRISTQLIATFGRDPRAADVSLGISRLVALFRALSGPARTLLHGIWAELFLIARASSPTTLLQCWHVDPTDTYDFNAGDQRVEVKSSQTTIRSHHFSLEQLSAPPKARVVVASVFVQSSGGGVSIPDLVDAIRVFAVRAPQLQLRVEEIVASSLGESYRSSSQCRFDLEVATRSLKFYDAESIPSVNPLVPPQVSRVQFVSDLAGCCELSRMEVQSAGGLLAAIVPR